MFRKLSVILVAAPLALSVACSSSSSAPAAVAATGSAVSAATATAAAAGSAAPSGCPTKNTERFAKTRFVADIALAGGAFKRYLYTPAKAGQFKKGADGKTLTLLKAATAGAFALNRLAAAKAAAEANPALCRALAQPLENFSVAVTDLVNQAKGGLGTINPADVDNGGNLLDDLHNAAKEGGAAFTDNQGTNA